MQACEPSATGTAQANGNMQDFTGGATATALSKRLSTMRPPAVTRAIFTVQDDGSWRNVASGAVSRPTRLLKIINGKTRTHHGLTYPMDGSVVLPRPNGGVSGLPREGALHLTEPAFVANWLHEMSSLMDAETALLYDVHLPPGTTVTSNAAVIGCGTAACGYTAWTVSALQLVGDGQPCRIAPCREFAKCAWCDAEHKRIKKQLLEEARRSDRYAIMPSLHGAAASTARDPRAREAFDAWYSGYMRTQ